MTRLFLLLTFFTLLATDKYPADITGKWIVDKVNSNGIEQVISTEMFEAVNEALIKPLNNATFDFRADHTFDLSAKLGKMPKGNYWDYNAENGVINIRESEDPESVVMMIKIFEKKGAIIFHIETSSVTLKVHKKIN